MSQKHHQIGSAAKALGVSADALRFYERQKLLVPGARSEGGYRLYMDEDLQRGRFIIHAKAVGFSLDEIAELLALEVTRDEQTCRDVQQFVEAKLEVVNRRLAEMEGVRDSLRQLSDACCGGSEPATHCTILDTLAHRGPVTDSGDNP
ncbi:MAG: Zn(2+)-responsive transcriptional regulator [Pseudomonadota bacterium]